MFPDSSPVPIRSTAIIRHGALLYAHCEATALRADHHPQGATAAHVVANSKSIGADIAHAGVSGDRVMGDGA